jgi:hypothetical protein
MKAKKLEKRTLNALENSFPQSIIYKSTTRKRVSV